MDNAHKVDDVGMKPAADTAPHTKESEAASARVAAEPAATEHAEFVHRVDAVCDVFEFESGSD